MAESNPSLKRFFATRQRLKVGFVVAGLTSGAIVGAAATRLGYVYREKSPARHFTEIGQ